MQSEFIIRNDKSEKVQYNSHDFPVYVRKGKLSTYPNFSAMSHWHDDTEFIYILSGQMQYNINGSIVHLKTGDGIFINTRQFHYGFLKKYECIFICVLLHPLLLCPSPYIEYKYVTPILQNECLPYIILHQEIESENEILKLIETIYENLPSETFALEVQSAYFAIWLKIFQLSGHVDKIKVSKNHHLSILKEMTNFIYNNYANKISLAEISQAGKVGKTSCCTIFQKFTNETPISYLSEYRLKKGIDLLLTTDKTITEICFDIGFSNPSYFTEAFHKVYKCTPSEYRILSKL